MGKTPGHSNTNTRLQALPDRQFFWGLLFIWISISGFATGDSILAKKVGVSRGLDVGFSCLATGHPRPTIAWKKCDLFLSNDHKNEIMELPVGSDTRKSTLLILSISNWDLGLYECWAGNKLIDLYILYDKDKIPDGI